MIEVQYRPYSVHIEGHAGYAERGKDIVCSASSMLLYTLERALDRYEKLEMCELSKTCYPGYAHIEAIRISDEKVKEAFNIIIDGYTLLSEQYPDYIQIRRA